MNKSRRKYTVCPNCATQLHESDEYCRKCGQENHNLSLPVREIAGEVMESTLHFDTKSFRTFRALITKPGFLTNQFNNGRRKSYVSPLRFYIFISFIFFLILNFAWKGYQDPGNGKAGNKYNLSFTFLDINSKELVGLNKAQVDSLMAVKGIDKNVFNIYVVKQLHRITNGGAEEFYLLLMKNISYTMFVLMPLFALLLWLFYRREGAFYIEYIIHSIHLHTFGFLLLAFYLISGRLISSIFFLAGIISLLIIYFYRSQRAAYGQRPFKTIMKTIAITILYLITILMTILLTLLTIVIIF